MNRAAAARPDHGVLMDSVYRSQRHIYDLTRKYYLFGRDGLIDGLNLTSGGSVLEVACGTGRNLDKVARRWPGARLFGLDISSEMLKSARARLGHRAVLADADATSFDPHTLFGQPGFDRVILSYSLSMIPDWTGALDQAARVLAPGGSLHVVDFGDCAGLPAPLRALLRAWLAKFHVAPRLDLADKAAALAEREGLDLHQRRGPFGYYRMLILSRRRA